MCASPSMVFAVAAHGNFQNGAGTGGIEIHREHTVDTIKDLPLSRLTLFTLSDIIL